MQDTGTVQVQPGSEHVQAMTVQSLFVLVRTSADAELAIVVNKDKRALPRGDIVTSDLSSRPTRGATGRAVIAARFRGAKKHVLLHVRTRWALAMSAAAEGAVL